MQIFRELKIWLNNHILNGPASSINYDNRYLLFAILFPIKPLLSINGLLMGFHEDLPEIINRMKFSILGLCSKKPLGFLIGLLSDYFTS